MRIAFGIALKKNVSPNPDTDTDFNCSLAPQWGGARKEIVRLHRCLNRLQPADRIVSECFGVNWVQRLKGS